MCSLDRPESVHALVFIPAPSSFFCFSILCFYNCSFFSSFSFSFSTSCCYCSSLQSGSRLCSLDHPESVHALVFIPASSSSSSSSISGSSSSSASSSSPSHPRPSRLSSSSASSSSSPLNPSSPSLRFPEDDSSCVFLATGGETGQVS